jgi:hypothetical protein
MLQAFAFHSPDKLVEDWSVVAASDRIQTKFRYREKVLSSTNHFLVKLQAARTVKPAPRTATYEPFQWGKTGSALKGYDAMCTIRIVTSSLFEIYP